MSRRTVNKLILVYYFAYDRNYTPNGNFESNVKHLLDHCLSKLPFPAVSTMAVAPKESLDKHFVETQYWQMMQARKSSKSCITEEAMIWYELCQVHYSYKMIFSLIWFIHYIHVPLTVLLSSHCIFVLFFFEGTTEYNFLKEQNRNCQRYIDLSVLKFIHIFKR